MNVACIPDDIVYSTRDNSPGEIREKEIFCDSDVILRTKHVTVVQKHCNGEDASQRKLIILNQAGGTSMSPFYVQILIYRRVWNTLYLSHLIHLRRVKRQFILDACVWRALIYMMKDRASHI
ncbi:hypothetical protein Y032_0390g542 [Ancylostoma ceylanicum]|nr:hypothetical protein Y032_0390g542 [Ancylostoma ceylanicum]